MKKALQFVLLFIGLPAICLAQSGLSHNDYKRHNTFNRYKIDATVGANFPIGYQPNGTLVLNVEPHYRLSDANAIGIRVQEAFLRQLNNSNLDGFTISPMDSYTLTFEHYFSNDFFRPF